MRTPILLLQLEIPHEVHLLHFGLEGEAATVVSVIDGALIGVNLVKDIAVAATGSQAAGIVQVHKMNRMLLLD